MSYYDWQHLTKPWKIIPVEQDKIENTKPLTITPVDDVTPKFITLLVPEVTFDLGLLMYGDPTIPMPQIIPAQMIGQYNYSVDAPFSLTNTDWINNPQLAYCVRWREGGDPTGQYDKVFRYLLGDLGEKDGPFPILQQWLPFQRYRNQAIKPNFVIEVWLKHNMYLPGNTVPAGGFSINTGALYFAPDADMPIPQIVPAQIVQLPELLTHVSVVPPDPPYWENLPNPVNPAGPWLTNGTMQGPPP